MVSEVKADYPPEARRLGIEGQVKVRVAVDRQGNVRWTRVDQVCRLRPGRGREAGPGPVQVQARRTACDGRLVDQVIPWTYTFQTER